MKQPLFLSTRLFLTFPTFQASKLAINDWFISVVSFLFLAPPVLAFPLPKTLSHQFAGRGEARLSLAYLPSPLCSHITLTWPSIFRHLPSTLCVYLLVRVCFGTLSCQTTLYFPAWNNPHFLSNWPWKLLCRLAAAPLAQKCLFGVV